MRCHTQTNPYQLRKDYFLWAIAAAYLAIPACLGYVIGKQRGVAETTKKYEAAQQTKAARTIATQNPLGALPVDTSRTR
ncbi:MAG: hypothetical protein PHX68_00190 [Alphaproteobacteria bacterium]|nr:hypothetical protein [Alphaproteobacteria bacterium]